MNKIFQKIKLLILLCLAANLTSVKVSIHHAYEIEATQPIPQAKLAVTSPRPTPYFLDEEITIITDNRAWTRFKYAKLIGETAIEYELDPQIIYATLMTESEGKENAYRYEPHINDASVCMGQILIGTARSLGFTGDYKTLYEPQICIDYVARYLRRLQDVYGEMEPITLAKAYNTGSPYKRAYPGHLTRFSKWFYEEI
jgi:soluble lytic murein transglycosylase-like protein